MLDVGCGPGTISADLSRRVAPGHVDAIDTSAEVIERARVLHPESDFPHLTFRTGDVYNIAAPDASYDIVFAHQVLQHLGDPLAALVEMRRVTSPDGLVAVRDADFGAFRWFPEDPRLDEWREVYFAVTSRNGAHAGAGPRLKMWARDAGLSDVSVSGSVWTFSTPDERAWWGGLWAERTENSDFARQAVDYGIATSSTLSSFAAAFRDWATHEDAVFSVPHVEIIARP